MAESTPANANQDPSAVVQLYYSRYAISQRKFDSDDPIDVQQAYREFEIMRRESEVPLVVKARCHFMLSFQTNDDDTQHMHALEHIDTAIRILEHVRSMTREGGAYPQHTYDGALKVRALLLKHKAELAELKAIAAEEANEDPADSEIIPDTSVDPQ